MLILAILLAVLAAAIWLFGAFAAGMSDAPGAENPLLGIAIGGAILALVCFGLWLGGFHLNIISRG